MRALNAARERLRDHSHTAMAEARGAGSLDVMRERMAGDIAAYEQIIGQRKPGGTGRGRAIGPGKGSSIPPGNPLKETESPAAGLGRLVRGLTSRVRRER
jgi:hypothetical protein